MKKYFYIIILILNFSPLFGQGEIRIIDRRGREFKSVQFLSIEQDSTVIRDDILFGYKLKDPADSLMKKYVLRKIRIDDIRFMYVNKPNITFYSTIVGGVVGYGLGTINKDANKGMSRASLSCVFGGIGLLYGLMSGFDTHYDLDQMNKIEKIKLIESLIVNEKK